MRPFNRYQIVQAITELLGVKGKLDVELSEQILPSVNVLDIWDSPYLRYGIPVGENINAAAVVGELGYVIARPGLDVALQVLKVVICNQGAALLDCSLIMMSSANIATLGVDLEAQMADLSGRTAGERRSSGIFRGTDAGTQGNSIATLNVPANQTLQLEIPAPGIILYGNDEGGRPGFGVIGGAANTALNASIFGREWPLPT